MVSRLTFAIYEQETKLVLLTKPSRLPGTCEQAMNGQSSNYFNLLFHDRYELITECWREHPSTRPSFFQLIEKLEVLLERDVEYFDLNKYDESSPYYNVPEGASAVV